MKKAIIEISEQEIAAYEVNLKVFKGGMEKYTETLKDSSTFYDEASTIGAITALKDILLEIESTKVFLEMHVDINEIHNCDDNSVVATLKTVSSQYDAIFREKENEQFIDVSEVDNCGQYIAIEGKFQANMNGINQIKDLIASYENIEVVYRPDFDKFDDSVSFKLSHVWKNKAALELELSKQGLDVSFVEKIRTNELDCYPLLMDSDDFEWDSHNEVFKTKQKLESTTLVDNRKYELISTDKYVTKIENQYFIADDENGKNSRPLEYLPEGFEMDFLNKLCDVFNEKIKIYDFKNNYSDFEEKRVIKLKEGEDDDSEGVNYIISNLVPDWQLKHAFKLASFVWNEIDDESISFDDIAKKVQKDFNNDLYEILNEVIPDSWYLILEMIFKDMNIDFQNISSKTFVI